MDWERINVWTNTLYTLIHSLSLAKDISFEDLHTLNDRARESSTWIAQDCSYSSILLAHPGGKNRITFRRDPNTHFADISRQLIKMLVQDLVVILDEMMDEVLKQRNEAAGDYPQSKIEKLKKSLNSDFHWAAHGCLELVAVRNVLTHSKGLWNEKSIAIVKSFVAPPPKVGEPLSIGITMLFRYRKAIRSLLNQLT
ncbi:hypothetical protein HS961_05995 [Comamonas piscis]|uniref:Uncharacterized protein n=1 Tax=Comamonas piscis TaxID=1562974 RepID=A0A7G5EEJ6_9BURK|nr:hypothetical protein [Comamonas piscis]QMV72421.1 hypothetical protein HS961_05995 [Comamonas piscis]WSO35188.1 hypothetical protein VUJ63_06020 [Comamonas piscis]